MELAAQTTSRSSQLNNLYDQLAGRHAQLQLDHKARTIEMTEYKTKANYWEAQFQIAKTREEKLTLENEELKAKLRKREQQLFGRRSEKNINTLETNPSKKMEPKKSRGQQPGSKGHGRRDYSHLPAMEETIGLKKEYTSCSCCGLPYEELADRETSEILETIHVQAHRRVIHRKRYKRQCHCKKNSDAQILLAPVAERLFPKCKLGVSIWALLLINKYEYQHPLYRTLEQLSNHGLSLSMGTVTDGMQKLLRYFVPVYDAICARNITATHWHADETGWKVFQALEGKTNNRWFLWIFHNKETVVYKIHPTRSSNVLIEHFGEAHPGGILNVDRFSAYKVIAKKGLFILAYCWAHVRRDFLAHAKGYTQQEDWALLWVEKISMLYHINNNRIKHNSKSKTFKKLHDELALEMKSMRKELDKQLSDVAILPSAKKLLVSLDKHWGGLTVFVEDEDIPMDNNQAERGLRPCVVGRKNYYGSGAIWSAQLATAMFTIFETLKLWKINPHTWLLTYLHECAMFKGDPPDTIEKFLPWMMKPNLLELFSKPPVHENPAESFC
jgi:transposase